MFQGFLPATGENCVSRPIQPELYMAGLQASRYVQSQWAEARRLGYPRLAAFAKEVSRGTVTLPPTPEDPALEQVGRFYWRLCKDIERSVLDKAYGDGGGTPYQHAKSLGMSLRRFHRVRERILLRLDGFLRALDA